MDTKNQKADERPMPNNGVLVSTHETQITTVDMFDQSRAKGALMVADMISTSSLIPIHYQRRPENVLVAMYRSARLGMDLFAYMETTYPVNGRIGHEAKFIVSLINKSGKFKTPLLYEMSGEIVRNKEGLLSPDSTRKCNAYAVLKETSDKISQEVDVKMAFLEGWTKKPGSDKTLKTNKWHTMTDVMLQYRAAKFFGNMYCPELVMGLNTREELEDISDAEVIEETETGKDIFEKGEPVDTTPDTVLDPAKEVKQQAAPQAVQPPETTEPTSEPVPQANTQEKQPTIPENASPVSAADIDTLALQDKNPPEDIVKFKEWFFKRFANESAEIDVFLLSKKWLTMGQTAADLTESKLKNFRAQWNRFLTAYETFKKSRKAGQK